jgi:hypothetical protein
MNELKEIIEKKKRERM